MKTSQINDIINDLKSNSIPLKKREGLWKLLLMDIKFGYRRVYAKSDAPGERRKYFRIRKGLEHADLETTNIYIDVIVSNDELSSGNDTING